MNSDLGARSYTDKLPDLNTPTVIGISVAIAGNVIISFALNLQKLAHNRTEKQREKEAEEQANRQSNGRAPPSLDESQEDSLRRSQSSLSAQTEPAEAVSESQPLLAIVPQDRPMYGSSSSEPDIRRQSSNKRGFISRLFGGRRLRRTPEPTVLPVDVVTADMLTADGHANGHDKKKPSDNGSLVENGNESHYLKSKLWFVYILS